MLKWKCMTKPNFFVPIKKITLCIWTLKAEIEAIISHEIKTKKEVKDKRVILETVREKINSHESSNSLPSEESVGSDSESPEENPPENTEEASSEENPPENTEEASSEDSTENLLESLDDSSSEAEKGDLVRLIQKKYPMPFDQLCFGKTVLYEITMDDIYFFCDRGFVEGQTIVIEFKVPRTFYIQAEVNHCRLINQNFSRIISENKLTHRIRAQFLFSKEGERTLLRQFVQSIAPDMSSIA